MRLRPTRHPRSAGRFGSRAGRRTTPAVLFAALAMLATQLFGGGVAQAAITLPAPPLPDDGFYRPAGDDLARPNGALLRTREAFVPFAPGAITRQLAFKTQTVTGADAVGVTTLLIPESFKPGAPVLTMDHFVNALGNQCQPSVTLTHPDVVRDTPLAFITASLVNLALSRGWVVNMPDHLGPTVAYGVGEVAAHVTLDSMRAARDFPERPLRDSQQALFGYSGGAISAGFAAAYQPQYAPELNVVGTAIGGNISDLVRFTRPILEAPNPALGLGIAVAIAAQRTYPSQMHLTEKLNEQGEQFVRDIEFGCTTEILARGAGITTTQLAAPGVNIGAVADEYAGFLESKMSLLGIPQTPRTPMYMWHSATDPLVPAEQTNLLAGRYCAAGLPVEKRLSNIPEHVGALLEGAPLALAYLGDRFAGAPAPSNC